MARKKQAQFVYDPAPVAAIAGENSAALVDVDRILLTRTVGVAPGALSLRYSSIDTAPLVNADFIKASPGRLRMVQGQGYSAVALYLLLVNKIVAPVNGDTPYWPAQLIPAGVLGVPFGFAFDDGIPFATGIAWCVSTTEDVVTLPVGAATFTLGALYV